MYIKSIRINSFGCISDKEYSFDKGFNLVYGNNESGKSTLFAFVVFMFYGTKIKKEPGGIAFKEKYMPWDGSPMQGSMTIFHNGLTYELSRTVSSTHNTFTIFCVDNATEIKDREILVSAGQYFLGVGVQAFYNTAYIGDAGFEHMSTDEVITKLTASNNSNVEEVSYNEILDIIDNEIADLSSERRKNAKIPVLLWDLMRKREELNKLSELTENAKSSLSDAESLRTDIISLEKEITLLKQNADTAFDGDATPKKTQYLYVFIAVIMSALLLIGMLYSGVKPILAMCVSGISFVSVLPLILRYKTSRQKDYNTKLFTIQQNNGKILELTEKLSVMKLEYQRKSDMLSSHAESNSKQDFILSEIQALESELSDLKTQLEAYKLARLVITKSYTEYKNEFGPKLSEISSRILGKLTDNKYNGTVISDELKLSFVSRYGYKQEALFSRGTVHQAELAKRIALSDVIFEGNVPLFFDDSLAFYDEDRLVNALDCLEEVSRKTQILFATCRKNELDIISQKNANILFFN